MSTNATASVANEPKKPPKSQESPVVTLTKGKKDLDLLSLPELEKACEKVKDAEWTVEGLVCKGLITIAVGDSGLGKSPLFYQMALCVTAGIPFLGHETKQGPVIYFDFENGLVQIRDLTRSLTRHLGINQDAEGLWVWSYGNNQKMKIMELIKKYRPAMCIIDSLRAFNPDAEKENSIAANLLNGFRYMAREFNTAILVVHHTKKPGEDGPPLLEKTLPMVWLLQACGARALINQSDIRIGIDVGAGGRRPPSRARANDQDNPTEEISLVFKGFARIRGEFGPVYVTRVFDENGDPLGYRRMGGVKLLFNEHQEKCYADLPHEFRFKDAMLSYQRAGEATTKFLKKCCNCDCA